MADNDNKIDNIVNNYQEIVNDMNTRKIIRNSKIESWVCLVVVIVAMAYVFWGAVSNNPQVKTLTTVFTIAIAAITFFSRSFIIQQKYYSTLESILFKLIDLEKECVGNELTCKIHQLIQDVREKMFK